MWPRTTCARQESHADVSWRPITKRSTLTTESFRLAELIAALSLATDLGMGQPLEQALRTCLITVRLGERLGLTSAELSDGYYVALLRFLGCTADSMETAAHTGGDELAFRSAMAPVLGAAPPQVLARMARELGRDQPPLRRAAIFVGFLGSVRMIRDGISAHCEVAEALALRLGLGKGVRSALAESFERWDGDGRPNRTRGEAIPILARLVSLARDAEVLSRLGEPGELMTALRSRSGSAYDPSLVSLFERHGRSILDEVTTCSIWETVLTAEPEPRSWVSDSRLEEILTVFADFVDLKSPFLAGHSRGVADLVGRVGGPAAARLRRAGLVHDLGRVGVPNGIWDKPGPLSSVEWERVRLHPYYTERILSRCPSLAPLAPLAGAHHERLDGSGYHRGSVASGIPDEARILAAADAYQAMTQPRPHRQAFSSERAADLLLEDARTGRLDSSAVQRVRDAAGHHAAPIRREWPAGLSDREVEVLRLLCQGSSKKQVADQLQIAPSTVDHHVRHIYEKAGVRSRAAVTLFAIEHNLLK